MRVFIAAELPEQMLEALAETSASLRGSVPGRYVGPDLFHVTLAFLGEVETYRVADVQVALETACEGHAAFASSLAALGSFGRKSRATLWQGFSDSGEFAALAHDVRAALSGEGFVFDEKRFIPHVTLMRNADLSAGVLPMPYVSDGVVDTVTLFRSDLSGKRPVYEPLHQVKLADARCGGEPTFA